MLRKISVSVFCFGLSLLCCAQVKFEVQKDNKIKAEWNGIEVLSPSCPKLTGGQEKKKFYDPMTRKYYDGTFNNALTVRNSFGKVVPLGKGNFSMNYKNNNVICEMNYPESNTKWSLTLKPVGDNGFDAIIKAETAPNQWLCNFSINAFKINLNNPKSDMGKFTGYVRTSAKSGHYDLSEENPGPVPPNRLRIVYPSPGMIIPAILSQDDKFAMATYLSGAHKKWKAPLGNFEMTPCDNNQKLQVKVSTYGYKAFPASFKEGYEQSFEQTWCFRFSKPRKVSEWGYLRLVDNKDLWQDYMDELNKYVPIMPIPKYDKNKNNMILMNFFMAAPEHQRKDNPLGWRLNSPGWEKIQWQWHHKPYGMKVFDKAAIQKIYGVYSDMAGPPANWIKSLAQKNINDMKSSNATAMIVWQTCRPRFSNTSYRPESHYFPEDLEERLVVKGKIRNWDWAVADITVKNLKGEILFNKNDVEIHCANTEKLMFPARFDFMLDETRYPLKQRIMFGSDETTDAAKKYVEKASLHYQYKFRDHKVIAIKFDMPTSKKELLGKTDGDTVTLKAFAVLNDRELAEEPLQVIAKIKGVKRAVIDVWGKMLTDAGVEFGFETSMHLTVGPGWQQYFQRLGFNSSWQYRTVKERIQWHKERFGKNCRWFYFDVFGTNEPQFVSQMLRTDFPDTFFFFEFDSDVVLRNVQSMHRPKYPLIDYIAPNSIGAANWLQWERDEQKVYESLKPYWHNPNYMIFTHGAQDRIIKIMKEKGEKVL